MEANFKLNKCSEEDALEFSTGIYKVKTVLLSIQNLFKDKIGKIVYDTLKAQQIDIPPGGSSDQSAIHYWNWFDSGIDCSILKLGAKSWQKGKVRIRVSLEFISDETEITNTSELSLDDLRQMEINNK
ncbi:MAG: hypothetical protein Kow0049_32480 [Stanieria sp.]